MNPSSRQVVRLTNQAASLVETRDYSEAVPMLRKALVMNKGIIERLDQKDAQSKSSRQKSSQLLHECTALPCTEGRRVSIDRVVPCYSEIGDYIYRRPLRIQESSPDNAGFHYHVTISLMIVFNLALALHLSGLESPLNPAKLEKAAALYTISQKILAGQDVDSGAVLFILASTNNMGQVLKALGREEVADEFFKRMLTTLFYLNDRKWEGSQFSLEGFYQNITHLILTNSQTAEAA
jgi:tetratricopeptide (TPR) repeat protein